MSTDSSGSDLHVLVTGTSDRLWKIAEPLEKVGDNVSTLQITGKESMHPLLQHIWINRPDIVVTDALGRAGAAVWILSFIFRIPCVLRIRGDAVSEQASNLCADLRLLSISNVVKDAISLFSTIITLIICNNQIYVSEFCRDESKMRYFANSNAVVIPTPLRIDDHDLSTEYRENNIILSVTNFNFEKKTMGLIDALNPIIQILDDHPKWTFKIAGGGEYLEQVRSAVAELETDSVEVLGYIDEIDNLYEKSDIFVHFSYLDAYPSTVLEASIYNNPIIANDGVGMSDQVIDQCNGYIVDIQDKKEIERRLAELLDDEQRRKKMGKRAADVVQENNSMSKVGDQLHEYLDTIR